MDKWDILKIVGKKSSTPYGSLLMELMDRYNKSCLQQITDEEVLEYLDSLIPKKGSIV